MKLTIIGGGGVRTPQLIPALVRRAERIGLREVWLMDIVSDKLAIIGELCQQLVSDAGDPFQLHLTTDARAAVDGAHHIITSVRVGWEAGRALDERICFQYGVLGQETTGAAGFAMAMRSIPIILSYARLIQEVAASDAWLYNFTNPAGLVVQALVDVGFERCIGICDSANGAQHAVARYLHLPEGRVQHRVYGLNHLSWTDSVRVDVDEDGTGGEEVLPALLEDPLFIQSTHMRMFADGLRRAHGAFFNEYLHYYYHRDEALSALMEKEETRGQQVWRLTDELLQQLRAARNIAERTRVYERVMGQRTATYMAHAQPKGADGQPQQRSDLKTVSLDDEGYAGVALGCVEAISTGQRHYTGLNVPNRGAIAGMADDDVVEIGCWVDSEGPKPMPIGSIPESQWLLMKQVKRYERLAARAILERSRDLAVLALAEHPLVGSYPLAEKLVTAFLEAHREDVGEWL